jgi:acyl-CoA synthetase (AMP-forming)/AMP-acid ligase II
MGACTVTATPKSFVSLPGAMKMGVVLVTLPTSYDAGGSVVDFSTSGLLTTTHGFQKVFAAIQCAQATAADDKYYATFIPAAADASATGLLKVRDLSAASDAEASGDLDAVVIRFLVIGT